MKRKKWVVSNCDRDCAASLSEACGIDPFACVLLASRGMTDELSVESFLFDTDLCDPFSLPDMEKACERINKALENGERITVFGDYDADGVTSTALMYSYLKSNGANVDYYIPDRAGEGYGMSEDAIDKLKERGTNLIITVDNGISAEKEVSRAKELGIDVVVTDHHREGESLPDAVAVVDPHRADFDGEFKEWAGVGVAFKVISALEGGDGLDVLSEYGDLLAIGTVADIVPLKGENRILVRAGLSLMNAQIENNELRIGFKALIEASGISEKSLTSSTAAFRIAPRINAAGRMGSAERALKLLITDSESEAKTLASEISEANALRQSIEGEITAAAIESINSNPAVRFSKVIVVSGENWHQGVIGIVASRLTEIYGKPSIVISTDNGTAKGSGRSIDGFSLYDALDYCSGVLTQFGGHTLAAGMSLESENIEDFRIKINEYADSLEMPVPVLKLDCKLNPASVSLDMITAMSILEPYGAENSQPLFGLFNMKITGIQPVGGGKHIRLNVSRNGVSLPVMMFSVSPSEFAYKESDIVDLAVRLSLNEYMGTKKVTVQARDIKFSAMNDDEVQKNYRIYEAFRGNKEIDRETRKKLIPDRELCGSVFRYIKSNNGWSFDAETLCFRLGLKENRIAPLKIALDMLTEIGVIIKNGEEYTLPKEQKKADLETSATYIRLSAD